VSVDSTVNRDHQHAAGARKKGEPGGDETGELEDPRRPAARQALGRSRGGLTTKVHLAVDGCGLPLSVVLTPGSVNDSTVFEVVLEAVRVPRGGRGRPRTRPDRVIADARSVLARGDRLIACGRPLPRAAGEDHAPARHALPPVTGSEAQLKRIRMRPSFEGSTSYRT
jgi:hypothetical protein